MDYALEADWQLLNTCNFRCSYCLSDQQLLGEKIRKFASPAAWTSAFDQTGKTWLVNLTGGEPGSYPELVELCRALTARHYISLNTNLTHRSFEAFAERIDPSRVSLINAGLHLEERNARVAQASFLRNAARLKAKGFPLVVSLVATPAALAHFDEAIALLAPIGLFPIPKLLREGFGGKRYPKAYSDAERVAFRSHAAAARGFYAASGERAAPPTMDMSNDERFLSGVPSYIGRACGAGSRFVKIEANGDVYRCSNKTALGNLLDGSLALLPGPTPCDTGYCFYWCEKYAAPRSASSTLDAVLKWAEARLRLPTVASA